MVKSGGKIDNAGGKFAGLRENGYFCTLKRNARVPLRQAALRRVPFRRTPPLVFEFNS
jgi:hypothetical protein